MAKAIVVQPGGGFERVTLTTREAPAPGFGEIKPRLRGSSLDYHDYAVVSGMWGHRSRASPWPTAPEACMSTVRACRSIGFDV